MGKPTLQRAICGLAWAIAMAQPALARSPYFKIRVIDAQTGRGVPRVELETVNHLRFYTDSAGVAAFFEPGLMNQSVFFFVRSDGYEFPKDGFGNAGVALVPRSGRSAILRLKRLNIAERLYRVTGEAIYGDSILVGDRAPIRDPLLDGGVVGQDSVMAVPYRGRLYWFWGDTSRSKYPLGNFHTSGATSEMPGHGGLDPSVGVNLKYFVSPDGFCRGMCPMKGAGPVWIDGVLTVPDDSGRERLLAHYVRVKDLGTIREHGLIVFDDRTETFKKLVAFDLKQRWQCPQGHPFRLADHGQHYFYFPVPYPVVRVKADLKDLGDPTSYEAFSCLKPGNPAGAAAAVDRAPDGKAVYAWNRGVEPMSSAAEASLIAAGQLKPDEARFQLKDIDTGKPVRAHSGSVNWNAWRDKWVMIAVQIMGTSVLGEVWYAEAESPTGPWRWAKRIVTHDHYSFYNPTQHPFFDQAGGRLLYFEGTYANTFSGNPVATPRYDYNQIMYRLDLGDPRLRRLFERTR